VVLGKLKYKLDILSKIDFFIDIGKNPIKNDVLFCFEIKYKGYGEKAVI